jgi:hypothetical protein
MLSLAVLRITCGAALAAPAGFAALAGFAVFEGAEVAGFLAGADLGAVPDWENPNPASKRRLDDKRILRISCIKGPNLLWFLTLIVVRCNESLFRYV